jgi:hypothetical protein
MFNPNDHNRIGTKKEVGQCCNCYYNDDSANDINRPCIVCYNTESPNLIDKKGFTYVAYSIYDGEDEDGDLIVSNDFKKQLTGFPDWCPLKEE